MTIPRNFRFIRQFSMSSFASYPLDLVSPLILLPQKIFQDLFREENLAWDFLVPQTSMNSWNTNISYVDRSYYCKQKNSATNFDKRLFHRGISHYITSATLEGNASVKSVMRTQQTSSFLEWHYLSSASIPYTTKVRFHSYITEYSHAWCADVKAQLCEMYWMIRANSATWQVIFAIL